MVLVRIERHSGFTSALPGESTGGRRRKIPQCERKAGVNELGVRPADDHDASPPAALIDVLGIRFAL
jgi:hypothetical protein